jgi:hypothetical protein
LILWYVKKRTFISAKNTEIKVSFPQSCGESPGRARKGKSASVLSFQSLKAELLPFITKKPDAVEMNEIHFYG